MPGRFSPRIIFITGTDTGVGKTTLTALLLTHLRRRNFRAYALKPFCTGDRAARARRRRRRTGQPAAPRGGAARRRRGHLPAHTRRHRSRDGTQRHARATLSSRFALVG